MKFSTILILSALATAMTVTTSYAQDIKKPTIDKIRPNPGLNAQVKLLSSASQSNLTYTIVKLPEKAILYYDGVKIENQGYTLDDPSKLTVDPIDGDVTVVFTFTVTTVSGEISDLQTIIIPFSDISISGSVFHDFDGNGIVDGERIYHLHDKLLYVTLINSQNEIVASKSVNEKGRYSFNNSDGLQPNQNYAVIISTKLNLFQSILPEAWSYSGESINSQSKKKDSQKDGAIVVKLREKPVTEVDFGLDIRPFAKSFTPKSQLNPGYNVTVPVPKLEGSDEENGKKVRYLLSSLPTNAILYENGKKITKDNIEIKKPSTLTIDPDDGNQEVTFTYVSADNVGVVSHPANIRMDFTGLSISGTLFEDGNSDLKVEGKVLSHIGDTPLFVTLLDEKKKVLASTPLTEDGTYSFDGNNGIVPNHNYRIILTTKSGGSTSILPLGWNSTGEGIMDSNAKKDGLNDGMVKVKVGTENISHVDFGINHKPIAETKRVKAQLNPGIDIQVNVPPLTGKDDEGNETLLYTIVSLPKNATLYDAGKKISQANVSISDPHKLTLDPEDGENEVNFSYLVTDAAGVDSNTVEIHMSFKALKLSGHLLNDGDGDANVNGEPLFQIEGKTLFVLLLDEKQILLSSQRIKKDGRFVFDGKDGVRPNTKYVLVLSTSKDKTGFTLAKAWNYTGENINSVSQGKDRESDGVIVVAVGKENITQIDFGINKKPIAKAIVATKQLNPGLDIQVKISSLEGEDLESGTNLIYTIESLPTLGRLYYDGELVNKAGFIVKERNKLTLDPKNGEQLVLFSYTAKDEAGITSDPARVQLSFSELHLLGRVVNDGDGNKHTKGSPIKIPSRLHPYATLLDENGNILASNPLTHTATFSFDGKDGVRPNANFTVVVSLKKNSRVPVLPAGWVESGASRESNNSSQEASADGSLNIHVFEKSIPSITFGLNKKPTAENKTVKSQINPGGKIKVTVPTLTGNDRESANKLRYRIIKLPDNATLYNKNKVVEKDDFVNPRDLSVDPEDGKQILHFSYVSVDPDQIQSDPAVVRMNFTGLSISGKVLEDFTIDGQVDSVMSIGDDKVTLFMTLLNQEGEILSSVSVDKEGNYIFDETKGVNAHTKYRVILSVDANATNPKLPDGWNHADGENINSLGKGNDGKSRWYDRCKSTRYRP